MNMYVNTTYRRDEVSNKASKVDGIHTKSTYDARKPKHKIYD